MKDIELQEHHLYELTYKLQTGNYGWYMYRATMTYLGPDRYGELQFNLRPLAGTQTLAKKYILEARDLGENLYGRRDNEHRHKVSLGRMKK